MRAFLLAGPGRPPALGETTPPVPGPREVVVRVRAASLNASDWKMAFGIFPVGDDDFPAVLGRDYSGIVVGIGEEVTRFANGDPVFGFQPDRPLVHGSFAEYVLVPEDQGIQHKPAGLGFTDAAALGVAGTTALATIDAVDPKPGDVVLVVGAAGGVGSYAVQLAAARGATIVAPCLPDDREVLRRWGAMFVPERSSDVVAAVREVAPEGARCLIDVASSGPGAAPDWRPVADGGVAGTVLRPPIEAPRGITAHACAASPAPAALDRLAAAVTAGLVRPAVTRVITLDEVGKALTTLRDGHTLGKVVVELAEG